MIAAYQRKETWPPLVSAKKGSFVKIFPMSALCSVLAALLAPNVEGAHLASSLKDGSPKLSSVGPLAFGPEGILFVADPKAATIYAIATDDTKPADTQKQIRVEGINREVASLLGTSADQILIQDLAVNPVSRQAYLAVSRGRGPDAAPVLIRVKSDGKLEVLSLDKMKSAKAVLPDAPTDGVVGSGQRRSNPRQESITDLAFLEDRVLVAGLANEEFASTLRAIPFPFQNVADGTSVEIYHGAHGKFETKSPVRTFVPFNIGDEPHLLAAYTCTPLVSFPISALKPNAKIKGLTLAELGNRNKPLDMIVYKKGGKDYILIANSSRGIMKVNTDNIEKAEGIESPVQGIKGLSYETIDKWTGVDQLDRLDQQYALVIRRGEGDALNLETLELP
jgi:hypothetical protein